MISTKRLKSKPNSSQAERPELGLNIRRQTGVSNDTRNLGCRRSPSKKCVTLLAGSKEIGGESKKLKPKDPTQIGFCVLMLFT